MTSWSWAETSFGVSLTPRTNVYCCGSRLVLSPQKAGISVAANEPWKPEKEKIEKTTLDSGLSTTKETEEKAGTGMAAVERDARVPHAGPTLQAYLPQP